MSKSATFSFDIDVPDELSAGLRGFSERLSITVESGELGVSDEEYIEYFSSCIGEWYETNRVKGKRV